MTIDDIKSFYDLKNDAQIARHFTVTTACVCKWRKDGLPYSRQCRIEIATGGKLKAQKVELSE